MKEWPLSPGFGASSRSVVVFFRRYPTTGGFPDLASPLVVDDLIQRVYSCRGYTLMSFLETVTLRVPFMGLHNVYLSCILWPDGLMRKGEML